MANYKEDIVSIELSTGTIHRSFMARSIGAGDEKADRFGIRAFRNGVPETLSGSCIGLFVRADGKTVTITNGVVSGNMAYVTLPEACYVVEGCFCLAIKVITANDAGTMRIVDGMVSRTSTDVLVDPGTVITSIEDLIEEIEEAVASIPTDYSDLVNTVNGISNGLDTLSTSVDKQNAKYESKGLINDSLESAFIPDGIENKVQSGTKTNGKAWRKNRGTPVSGSQYCYVEYEVPSSYAGNVAIIYGHGWGAPYPLACFYDSNNELLISAGEKGNTAYKGVPVIIPSGTDTIVVNGRSDSAYNVGIAFYSLNDAKGILKGFISFNELISTDFLSSHSDYTNIKNWPSNCIYSIANDVYSLIDYLPEELDTYATILKANGTDNTNHPYSMYICVNEYAVWIGFETTTALSWRLLSGGSPTKKYLFIGDSYGDGYSHDGNNSGWCTYLVNELGLYTGEYESIHQGGSGFNNGGFLARLNAATLKGVTDIVVLGGFNDYNATGENIRSAMSTFCARCRALYPNANIWIGCVGWIKEGTGESAYQNWQEVRAAITDKVLPAYQNAPKYGAKYLNMVEYLLTDAMMTPTDGYHPGETGNKAIAKGVANGLMTGTVCMPFNSDWKG